MSSFYLLILFVTHCTLGASYVVPSRDTLVLIGDYSHDEQSIQNMAYCQVLNKYNLFGKTRRDLFKFFRFKTPPLFLTCKEMYVILDLPLVTVSGQDMPKDLEEQLAFLNQF